MAEQGTSGTPAAPPAAAPTGGTIAQLREASRSGALQGIDKPAGSAGTKAPVTQETPADRVGDLETLGHDNAAEEGSEEDPSGSEEDPVEIDPNDPWEADLHGLKTRDVLEALKSGNFPPELAKALKVIAKVNGIELPISIDEATRGYQRLSDYSKARNELRAEAAQLAEFRQSFEQMVQTWKDPASLRKGMKSLGLESHLFEAAKVIASEWLQEQQLPPAERALKAQLRQMQDQYDAAMAKFEQVNKPPGDARAEQLIQQLGKMVPVAMVNHQISDSPTARNYFSDNLKALWEPGTDLTEELVNEAAQATAEQLGDLARKHAGAIQPKKPIARPLPARAGAAPGPGGGPQIGNGRGGATIADFKKAFNQR